MFAWVLQQMRLPAGRLAVLPEVLGLVTNQGAIASNEAFIQAIQRALWRVAPTPERHQLQLVDADVAVLDQLRIVP
jgi:hypothetical protein